MRFLLLLTLPIYALDQATKWWVLRNIAPDDWRVVIPDFFTLIFVTNSGAAFGSFKNMSAFFVILASLALVVVSYLLLRPHARNLWRDFSLALLLAGIAGNLTDRIFHGHVIDFLLFDLHVPFAHPWPAFNVADSCIFLAVCGFVLESFRRAQPEPLAPAP